MLDLSGTFDSTNALSGMFLWLIFGYLAGMLNCDLQRFLQSHPLVIHLFGIVAFFFLFTVIDNNNKASIGAVWAKTFILYILFVLMTKSKWYFVIPVLVILLIDQTLKKDIAFQKARIEQMVTGEAKEAQIAEEFARKEARQRKISYVLNISILVIIITGTMHYMYLQWIEYGDKFNFYDFFIGVHRCKTSMPDYKKMVMNRDIIIHK